ncbi:MAG: LysM domain-containing protein, partial [Myxococcota bacterium]
MADLSQIVYAVEVTRLRDPETKPGALKTTNDAGSVRLPLGARSNIELDANKSKLVLTGDAKSAKVTGTVHARSMQLGEEPPKKGARSTRIDTDAASGVVEIDLVQGGGTGWRDAVWRFSDLRAQVRDMQLPTGEGNFLQLGGPGAKISGSMIFARAGIPGVAKQPTAVLDLQYDGDMPRLTYRGDKGASRPLVDATEAHLTGRLTLNENGVALDAKVARAKIAVAAGKGKQPVELAVRDMTLKVQRGKHAVQLEVELGDSQMRLADGLTLDVPAGARLAVSMGDVKDAGSKGSAALSFEVRTQDVPKALRSSQYVKVTRLEGARARVYVDLGTIESNAGGVTLSDPSVALELNASQVVGQVKLAFVQTGVQEGDTLSSVAASRDLVPSQLVELNPHLDGSLGRVFVDRRLDAKIIAATRAPMSLSALAKSQQITVAELLERHPNLLSLPLVQVLGAAERQLKVRAVDTALAPADVQLATKDVSTKPPLSIEPAALEGMQPTTNVVQAVGLLRDGDFGIRIPMVPGAWIGDSFTSKMQVQRPRQLPGRGANEPYAQVSAQVRDGKVVGIDVTFEPFLDGHFANLKSIKFVLDPKTKRLVPVATQDGVRLVSNAKVTNALTDELNRFLGTSSGGIPVDVGELVRAIDAAVKRHKLLAAKGTAVSADDLGAFDLARTQVTVKNAQIRGERKEQLQGPFTLGALEKSHGVAAEHLLRANPTLDRILAAIVTKETGKLGNPRPDGTPREVIAGPTDTLSVLAKRLGVTVDAVLAAHPDLRTHQLGERRKVRELVVPAILDLGHGNAVDIISATNVQVQGRWPYLTVSFDGQVREFVYRQKDDAGKTSASIVGGYGDVSIELAMRPDKTREDKLVPPSSFRLRGQLETEEVVLGNMVKIGPSRLTNFDLSVTSDKLAKNNDGILMPVSGSQKIAFSAAGDISLRQGWIGLQSSGGDQTGAAIGENRFRGTLSVVQDPTFTAKYARDLQDFRQDLISSHVDQSALERVWPKAATKVGRPEDEVLSPKERAALLRGIRVLLNGTKVDKARAKDLAARAERQLFPWQLEASGKVYAADIEIKQVQSAESPTPTRPSAQGVSLKWKVSSARFEGASQSRALAADEEKTLRQAISNARALLESSSHRDRRLQKLLDPAVVDGLKGGSRAALSQRRTFAEALWTETSLSSENSGEVRKALGQVYEAALPPVAELMVSTTEGVAVRRGRGVALTVNLGGGEAKTGDGKYRVVLGPATLTLKPNEVALDGSGAPKLGQGIMTDGGSLAGKVKEVRIEVDGKPIVAKDGTLSVDVKDVDLVPGQILPDVELGKVTMHVKVESKDDLARLLHLENVRVVEGLGGWVDVTLGSLVFRRDGTFIVRDATVRGEAHATKVQIDTGTPAPK